MNQFQTKTYSVADFLEWQQGGTLVLSPKFQRRDVWTPKARSYFLDSVIRGKPAPKILLREQITPAKKTIREVVDGQQRLRALFEYISNGFPVSRTHNPDYPGFYFVDLPDEVQTAILAYQIATDCLVNLGDAEIRDIFARLNTYGVKLNKIELLHAEYFGDFRTSAFALANELGQFWTKNAILTENRLSRMLDAELTAELLIVMADGIQDKNKLGSYFKKWDDTFPKRRVHEGRFRDVIDIIGCLFPDGLRGHVFRRPVLFYSLFSAITHMQFGVPRLKSPRARIQRRTTVRVSNELLEVDAIWDTKGRDENEVAFLSAAKRATTHQREREVRTKFLCELIRKGCLS